MSSATLRGLGLATLLFFAGAVLAEPQPAARQQGEDFDALCGALDEGYVYFEVDHAAWKKLCEKWRPRAAGATTRTEFVSALEGLVEELHDDNVTLSEHTSASPRQLPWDTDLYAVWRGDVPLIDSVRVFGDADVAGLRPGAVVLKVDDVPVEQAIRNRLGPGTPSRRARSWALRHAIAGPMSGAVSITVRDGTQVQTVHLERSEPRSRIGRPVYGRRMGDERDVGYLRVRIGVDDAKLPGQFDTALDQLMDTRALILDLRDHPGPGAPGVARVILSRFASTEVAWQLREPREGPRVFDTVAPRGRLYKGKLIVLVDRWTAAEGEAVATGLVPVANAHVVGTRMTGLRGVLREVRLPNSHIGVSFPVERVFLVNGERREAYVPEVLVDLAAPQGGPGDPVLYQGLKLLEPCPAPSCRSAPGSQPPARASPRR